MNCPRCKRELEDGSAMCLGCGFMSGPTTLKEAAETVTDDDAPARDGVAERFAPLARRQSFVGLLVHSALGEGAMGAAYLASHPVLQMPLVIKLFKTGAQTDIFSEAHLAARVASPHVVGVIDAGIADGIPYVIQRYIDGIDLAELLGYMQGGRWRLPVNTVCRMLIDAASGLHTIHQAGVLHRDVKPANLFLTGEGTTTVGDFGVAVDAARAGGEGGPVMGTPMFMAPEQWLQQEPGRCTDVYALGATAHLLLTGEPAFAARTVEQMAQAHLYEDYRPPVARSPIEAYVFSVVERMLRKGPEARYQTAEALARVLGVVVEPGPRFAPTESDGARVGPLRVSLAVGDIAAGAADVIVNAANSDMVMDMGVAAALHRAAGGAVEEEATRSAPAAMGEVVWTGAGRLPARWVAHAVSAISGAVCLQRCALRVLLGAEARGAVSVVFPALGTGVGGVPTDLGAKLMLEAVRTFASFEPRHVRDIRVVLYDDHTLTRWHNILRSI